MRQMLRVLEVFDVDDESITYNVWMLDSSFLVTSVNGPIKEFATLEEAEIFAEKLAMPA